MSMTFSFTTRKLTWYIGLSAQKFSFHANCLFFRVTRTEVLKQLELRKLDYLLFFWQTKVNSFAALRHDIWTPVEPGTILFTHNLLIRCQIYFSFCSEHGNDIAIACANFRNDLTAELDVLDWRDFATLVLIWVWDGFFILYQPQDSGPAHEHSFVVFKDTGSYIWILNYMCN